MKVMLGKMKQNLLIPLVVIAIVAVAGALYLQGGIHIQVPIPTGTTTAAPTSPSLKIISPSNGATVEGPNVVVTLSASGFSIPEQGHYHVFLDNSEQRGPGPSFTFTNVAVGSHTIRAELHNPDHSALNPEVTQTIGITITAATATTTRVAKTREITAVLDHSSGYIFSGDGVSGTTITINKDDTVRITASSNQPSHNHGITIDEYQVNKAVIQPNTVIEFVANRAGTFNIYCKTCLDGPLGAHPWMKGTLVVNP